MKTFDTSYDDIDRRIMNLCYSWLLHFAPWELPGLAAFPEASKSCNIISHRRAVTSGQQYPLEDSLIDSLIHGQGQLSSLASEIVEAIENNNYAFFRTLARALKQLSTNSFDTSPFVNSVITLLDENCQDCAGLVSVFWIDGLLWLMTDKAIGSLFRIVAGRNFTTDAIRKARERHKLIHHPDRPIVDVVMDKNGPALSLRNGWTNLEKDLARNVRRKKG